MKKAITVVLTLVVMVVSAFGCGKLYLKVKQEKIQSTIYEIEKSFSEYEIKENTLCYAYDISDLKKLVGFSQFVFVAEVKELKGTTYQDVNTYIDGTVDANPFTNYVIRVLYNIKGNLNTDEIIPAAIFGGINYDEYTITCIPDSLPQVENIYVFCANAGDDGELYIDPASNFEINDFDIENPEKCVEKYIEAYKNQDTNVPKCAKYSCKYENL